MPTCTILLESFTMITSEELIKIVSVINKTTCCCCRPTPPCLFGGVLPYFEVTGHLVLVSSLGLSVRIVSFGTVAILSILQR